MSLEPEQIDQINLMNWIKHNYPEIAEDTYHFANERKCTIQQGALLKRMGVKRGVSDIFIPIPRKGKSGLWIELKVGKGQPTKEQKEFLARMIVNGFEAVCVWGWEAAKEIIIAYFSQKSSS